MRPGDRRYLRYQRRTILRWYTEHFPSIQQATGDYAALLANPQVEAVYCAVPHHLHREVYCAAIAAGKHLMGEKPFGIDRPANDAILACAGRHPQAFWCAAPRSFRSFRPCSASAAMIEAGAVRADLEVNAGFLHSSDLDPQKPLNWKRKTSIQRPVRLPGRSGNARVPRAVSCGLDRRELFGPCCRRSSAGGRMARGSLAPCETWDNATLLCDAPTRPAATHFPMTLKTQRIAPGEKNTWYLEVLATQVSARFSTKNPKRLEVLEYSGGEQVWRPDRHGPGDGV